MIPISACMKTLLCRVQLIKIATAKNVKKKKKGERVRKASSV
jgi:hypothetical protein